MPERAGGNAGGQCLTARDHIHLLSQDPVQCIWIGSQDLGHERIMRARSDKSPLRKSRNHSQIPTFAAKFHPDSPWPNGIDGALLSLGGLLQNSSEDQLHHYMWARCCGVHQHPVRRILRLAILKQPVGQQRCSIVVASALRTKAGRGKRGRVGYMGYVGLSGQKAGRR
jgi:hypothetical protein